MGYTERCFIFPKDKEMLKRMKKDLELKSVAEAIHILCQIKTMSMEDTKNTK